MFTVLFYSIPSVSRDGRCRSVPLLTSTMRHLVSAIQSNDIITRISLGALPDVLRQKSESMRKDEENSRRTWNCTPGQSPQTNRSRSKTFPMGPSDPEVPIALIPVDPLLVDIHGALEAMDSVKDVLNLSLAWRDWMFDHIIKQKIEIAEIAAAARLRALRVAAMVLEEEKREKDKLQKRHSEKMLNLEIAPLSSSSQDPIETEIKILSKENNSSRRYIDDGGAVDSTYDYSPSGRKREGEEDWDTTWATSFDYMSPRKMIQKLEAFRDLAERTIGEPSISLTSHESSDQRHRSDNKCDDNYNNNRKYDHRYKNENSCHNNHLDGKDDQQSHASGDDDNRPNYHNNSSSSSSSYNRNEGLNFVYDHSSNRDSNSNRNSNFNGNDIVGNGFSTHNSHLHSQHSPSSSSNNWNSNSNRNRNHSSTDTADDTRMIRVSSDDGPFSPESCSVFMTELPDDMSISLAGDVDIDTDMNVNMRDVGENSYSKGGWSSREGRERDRVENAYKRRTDGGQSAKQPSSRRERSRERVAQQLLSLSRPQSTCNSTDKSTIFDVRRQSKHNNLHIEQLPSDKPVHIKFSHFTSSSIVIIASK